MHIKDEGVLKIKGLKKSMSQLFDENAKVIPYTTVSLTEKNDDLLKGLVFNDEIIISSKAKGRGFTGVMKRWNFGGNNATHGWEMHRSGGSIGAQGYGRVLKGKKMPGHKGDNVVTKRTKFVGFDQKTGSIWVKGAVPGGFNSEVTVYLKPNN